MLFLKHFNVLDQTLLGVGKIHVHVSQTIAVLCQTLVDKMGFSGRTQLCWTQFPWHVTPAPQRLTTRVCRIPQEHGVSTRHDDFATKIIHQAASVAELGLDDRDILCFENRLDANETYARRRLLRSPLPARTDRPIHPSLRAGATLASAAWP